MKKLLSILFVLSILFSFCACSNMSDFNDKTTESTTENTTKTTTQTQEISMENTTEKFDNRITVKIGNESFTAELYDNETAKAFAEMLPITLDMNELHGNEKYYYFNNSLPTDTSDIGKINSGDLMLYGSDCLVLFYDSFSTNYRYTKIGHIENSSDLANAVGNGNITITFDK